MAQHHLTLTASALDSLLDGFVASPARLAVCPAGISDLIDHREWLVHAVSSQPVPETGSRPWVHVVCGDSADRLRQAVDALLVGGRTATPCVVLGLGIGPTAGQATAGWASPDGRGPVEALRIAASGMPLVKLTPLREGAPLPRDGQAVAARPGLTLPEEGLWSRTRGALGEAGWRRLRALRVAVLGCGRSGSLAAAALWQTGVARLTLIDPDTLEEHNLGEMDAVTPADLGCAKVEAVTSALRGRPGGADSVLEPVAESALSLSALAGVKRSDVLVCCVDNGAARLAAAFLAALYLRPLLDVGTGIFRVGEVRRMGADVRLVLPGAGCLLCQGGIAGLEGARRELLASPTPAPPGDWRRHRAGSLRSLNGVAVHLGLRLLEDLMDGRLVGSIWLHLEFDGAGVPGLEIRRPGPDQACRLCRFTGHGDAGLPRLSEITA
jgi:molybdopterin/thiamine biosynthesis adenylyltransferase